MVLMVLGWSLIKPHDYLTWFLEVFPALIGIVILLMTADSFPLTSLAYTLLAAHAIVLIIGGHYTYAEVPFFNWLRDYYGLSRNYYDRVGHLMQGLVPAIVAREILIRLSPVKEGKWLALLCLCICGTITSLYELLEWAVALVSKTAADSFLGTQGDVWDTQWDMFLAFVGALLALALFSRWHDRQLRNQA
jgi:putative membrane protein